MVAALLREIGEMHHSASDNYYDKRKSFMLSMRGCGG